MPQDKQCGIPYIRLSNIVIWLAREGHMTHDSGRKYNKTFKGIYEAHLLP